MKTYKLIYEEINEEYPVKNIGNFDPFVEYFMFDKKFKQVYIIRSIEQEIYLINLFSFVVSKISNDDFKELPKKYEVFRLPHYTGGCCDYTNKHKKLEQEERIKMFEKILCFMGESEVSK